MSSSSPPPPLPSAPPPTAFPASASASPSPSPSDGAPSSPSTAAPPLPSSLPPPRPSRAPYTRDNVMVMSVTDQKSRMAASAKRLHTTLHATVNMINKEELDVDESDSEEADDLPALPDVYADVSARDMLVDFMCEDDTLPVPADSPFAGLASPSRKDTTLLKWNGGIAPPPDAAPPLPPPDSHPTPSPSSTPSLPPLPPPTASAPSPTVPARTDLGGNTIFPLSSLPHLSLPKPCLLGNAATEGRSREFYDMKENSWIVSWTLDQRVKRVKTRHRHQKRKDALEGKLFQKFNLRYHDVQREQSQVGQGADDIDTKRFLKYQEGAEGKKSKRAAKKLAKKQRLLEKEARNKEKNKALSDAGKGSKDEKGKGKSSGSTDGAKKKALKDPYMVLLVGNSKTGKSTLLNKYLTGAHEPTYTPTRFKIHQAVVKFRSQTAEVEFWDTSALPRYEKRLMLCYKTASCILICFSVVDYQSYLDVSVKFSDVAHRNVRGKPILLVGTHKDQLGSAAAPNDYFKLSDAQNLANNIGAHLLLTSSITGDGVQAVFDEAIRWNWDEFLSKQEKKGLGEELKDEFTKNVSRWDKYNDQDVV
eukprot:TRINITY_DN10817_c0_g1_i1.p1 TRINITY_DN10817_c0_g1~~TRINITY_DN10817_c0_g1_i1.p1  ORF type:complete len:590 (-),score=153.60 TRINITY_DN10817_c0_g1_i1:105-1874(-)